MNTIFVGNPVFWKIRFIKLLFMRLFIPRNTSTIFNFGRKAMPFSPEPAKIFKVINKFKNYCPPDWDFELDNSFNPAYDFMTSDSFINPGFCVDQLFLCQYLKVFKLYDFYQAQLKLLELKKNFPLELIKECERFLQNIFEVKFDFYYFLILIENDVFLEKENLRKIIQYLNTKSKEYIKIKNLNLNEIIGYINSSYKNMVCHFVWLGEPPHSDTLKKAIDKMKYLNTVFTGDRTTFYIWTTQELSRKIEFKLILDRFSQKKVKVKAIEGLFNEHNFNILLKNNIDLSHLKNGILLESKGVLANFAFATDILKILLLYFYGGLYVDFGLEIETTLYTHLSALGRHSLSGVSNDLFEKLQKCDFGFTDVYFKHFDGTKDYIQPDIQILYRNKTLKSDFVFKKILKEFSENFRNQGFLKEINNYRMIRTNNNRDDRGSEVSWTGKMILDEFNKIRKNKYYKIHLFEVILLKIGSKLQSQYSDFPNIYLKDPATQKYDNYRTKNYRNAKYPLL